MTLTASDVVFHYPATAVLGGVSFSVGQGECVAVLGTNGAGKSTLLKCLNRILQQHSGEVVVCDVNIRAMTGTDLAQRVGYVAQSNRFSDTTVFDAILLGRKPYIKWDVTGHDLEIAEDVLGRLRLEDYAMRRVDELSGGEMQKVSIARALAQQPDVLLFDEPTSNLDLKNQLEVIRIIREIVRENNVSAIVTMHDLNLALRFADRFLMLKDGEVFAAGGRDILNSENIKAVYDVDVVIEMYEGQEVVILR